MARMDVSETLGKDEVAYAVTLLREALRPPMDQASAERILDELAKEARAVLAPSTTKSSGRCATPMSCGGSRNRARSIRCTKRR